MNNLKVLASVVATGFTVLVSAQSPSNSYRLTKLSVSEIPANARFKGKLIEAYKWQDKMGQNILITSVYGPYREKVKNADQEEIRKSADLFAYHYCKRDTGYKLIWKLTDGERKCEFDLTTGFIKSSTAITDLDKDGIAETTILYKLSCRSDVSPSAMKLIMHEDSVKYALRGMMWVQGTPAEKFKVTEKDVNLEKLPKPTEEWEIYSQLSGRYENEKDFKSVPEFLEFARKHWLKFVKESF